MSNPFIGPLMGLLLFVMMVMATICGMGIYSMLAAL